MKKITVLGSIITLFGIALIIYSNIHFNEKKWDAAVGIITDTSISEDEDYKDRTVYKAFVLCEYTVDGKNYNSKVEIIDNRNKSVVQNTLNRYPVGRNIDILYRVDKKNESILKGGLHSQKKDYIVKGIASLSFGIFSVLMSVLLIKKAPSLFENKTDKNCIECLGRLERGIKKQEVLCPNCNAVNTVHSKGRFSCTNCANEFIHNTFVICPKCSKQVIFDNNLDLITEPYINAVCPFCGLAFNFSKK